MKSSIVILFYDCTNDLKDKISKNIFIYAHNYIFIKCKQVRTPVWIPS